MGYFELQSFSEERILAETVAKQWLTQLGSLAASQSYYVALSGGRIAKHFFEATTTLVKNSRPRSLNSVHFFWGDERCVPPEDPESNFGIANHLLLAPLEIPGDRIHRVRGELEPKTAAIEAEAEMRRIVPAIDGQPMLDLIFLGMGEDGHVASLFPGESEATIKAAAVYRPVVATKPPPNRITLGYGAIAAARQVWVLASGAGKEEALGKSLASEGQTPLARVLKLREHTIIFTDVNSGGRNGGDRLDKI
jgi:6-phosphogluconolactonase